MSARNRQITGFVALLLISGLPACDGVRGAGNPAEVASPAARVALGKRLFLDARLSADGQVSCASCHRPDAAFADGQPVSVGVQGRKGTRNAPSLLDASVMSRFFWDGREGRLEAAVIQPFTNPVEMGLKSPTSLIDRINADAGYRLKFAAAFPGDAEVSTEKVGRALAAYVHALNHGRSAYDRYRSGDTQILDTDQKAGLDLFAGKAECGTCHRLEGQPASFTDDQYHHLGISDSGVAGRISELAGRVEANSQNLGHFVLSQADVAGLGRFVVTRKVAHLAAFRTPSLRNVGVTAPYMHDGSVATLEAAVDHELYYRGLSKGRPLALTVEERRQLVAFLRALTNNGQEPEGITNH